MMMMGHGMGAADWGEPKKAGVSWKSLRRMLAYARPYRGLIAFTSLDSCHLS
jgi:hypothetical protein